MHRKFKARLYLRFRMADGKQSPYCAALLTASDPICRSPHRKFFSRQGYVDEIMRDMQIALEKNFDRAILFAVPAVGSGSGRRSKDTRRPEEQQTRKQSTQAQNE